MDVLTENKQGYEARKKFYMDCHLASLKYHDADEVWDKGGAPFGALAKQPI